MKIIVDSLGRVVHLFGSDDFLGLLEPAVDGHVQRGAFLGKRCVDIGRFIHWFAVDFGDYVTRFEAAAGTVND